MSITMQKKTIVKSTQLMKKKIQANKSITLLE